MSSPPPARLAATLVLLACVLGSPAAARPGEPIKRDAPIDTLAERYVLLPGAAPSTPVEARRGAEIFPQSVAYQGARFAAGASVAYSPTARFEPDRGGLLRVDWLRALPPFISGQALNSRPMGELYCAWGRADRGRRMLCFRDADSDGAFEAVAEAGQIIWPRLGALDFAPITPLPYEGSPMDGPDDARIKQKLAIYTYNLGDQLRVGLQLHVHPVFSNTGRGLAESELVDRADLPKVVKLHGLQLTVLAFDKKDTALVRLDRPMAPGPLTLEANDPSDLRKGFRIVDPAP